MLTHPLGERERVCLAQRGPPLLHLLVSFGQWLTSFSPVLVKGSCQLIITFRLAPLPDHASSGSPLSAFGLKRIQGLKARSEMSAKARQHHDLKFATAEAGAKCAHNAS